MPSPAPAQKSVTPGPSAWHCLDPSTSASYRAHRQVAATTSGLSPPPLPSPLSPVPGTLFLSAELSSPSLSSSTLTANGVTIANLDRRQSHRLAIAVRRGHGAQQRRPRIQPRRNVHRSLAGIRARVPEHRSSGPLRGGPLCSAPGRARRPGSWPPGGRARAGTRTLPRWLPRTGLGPGPGLCRPIARPVMRSGVLAVILSDRVFVVGKRNRGMANSAIDFMQCLRLAEEFAIPPGCP